MADSAIAAVAIGHPQKVLGRLRDRPPGGMATVYLARDLKHDRDVALKVLRPELGAALGAERFPAEIRITAGLDHPHILTLIDSGTADGFLYYVLPFGRGESLRAKLTRERQLALDEALSNRSGPRPVRHMSISGDLRRVTLIERNYVGDAWMSRVVQR
jgi:serine/threonine protein kinase